jgi:hypothetical protein
MKEVRIAHRSETKDRNQMKYRSERRVPKNRMEGTEQSRAENRRNQQS